MIDMVRMPPELGRGFAKQFDFGTNVVRLDPFGGREVVRTREMPRRYWVAQKGVFSKARIEEFVGFIQARGGAFHAFRFWDPSDFSTAQTSPTGTPSATDQFLGVGDGTRTEFDLIRVYSSTSGDHPQRRAVDDRMLWIHGETDARLAACIGLPSTHSFALAVALNGTPTTSFTLDQRRRKIKLNSAPSSGVVVTAGGYYDWPVVLGEDSDRAFETIVESWTAQSAPAIQLECVPHEKFAPDTDDPGGARIVQWATGTPILRKHEGKLVGLIPFAGSLSVMLEDPSELASGGPHYIINNVAAASQTVTLKDELTGATIVSLLAGNTAHCFIETVTGGGTRNWFVVVT